MLFCYSQLHRCSNQCDAQGLNHQSMYGILSPKHQLKHHNNLSHHPRQVPPSPVCAEQDQAILVDEDAVRISA